MATETHVSEICKKEFEGINKRLDHQDENQKDISKTMSAFSERIVAVEQSAKSAHKRLQSQDEQTKAIVEMSSSVKYMAKQVEETVNILKEHDGRLDKLEKAPGDAMIAYWKLFLGAIITGSAGVILGMLINKGGM